MINPDFEEQMAWLMQNIERCEKRIAEERDFAASFTKALEELVTKGRISRGDVEKRWGIHKALHPKRES